MGGAASLCASPFALAQTAYPNKLLRWIILYFAGRADDLLKVGGQWVAPLQVEECLLGHQAVAACAVIGIEEEGLIKTKAFVVVRAGHAPTPALGTALQEHVRTTLAKYKYPRVVEFVDDLPKNDRGKVDKKALRARGAGDAGDSSGLGGEA